MRVPLIALVCLTFSCQGQSVQSTEQKDQPMEKNCFEQLHPERQEGAYLTGVAYQHGACKDGYKALNKFAYAEEVKLSHTDRVDRLDELESSKVYVDEESNAYVKYEGENIVVGKIKEQGVEARLDLDDSVQYGYYFESDGQVNRWTLDGSASAQDDGNGSVVLVHDRFK